MYFDYLWRMLEPLGIYSGTGYNGGELQALGAALDRVQEKMGEYAREMLPGTAEEAGLEMAEGLFPMLASSDLTERRGALAVLFSTDNRCCGIEALVETLGACGVPVTMGETGNKWECIVSLTELLAIEDDPVFLFWLMEQVLPCHLVTVVVFDYVDVESGETVHERMTLSLIRQRTQAEWEQRLGAIE